MNSIFDLLTSPLGLPVNPLLEYVILAVVGGIAYRIAFAKVGEISLEFGISNSGLMSILHWIIRIIAFVPIWAMLYGICYVIKLVISLF